MRNPVSRFAYSQADLDFKRSRFDRSHDHKFTMSTGKLYPILVDEVYPGDTFSVDTASVIRMSTPIHPVMDNIFCDTFYFFVPTRIIWDHWKEFMGESPVDPYINPIEYSVPQITFDAPADPEDPDGAISIPFKSTLDYLGIPAGTMPGSVSALPLRAFCKIWNEWFRDQNLMHAIDLDTSDRNIDGALVWESGVDRYMTGAFYESTNHGGQLPPVAKYHDYFTSALKEPQKGDAVPIPLSGFAPVYANNLVDITSLGFEATKPPKVIHRDGRIVDEGALVTDAGGNLKDGYPTAGTIPSSTQVTFRDLGADLSHLAGTYATISDLRSAFQLQRFLQKDNIGGSRYRELLKAHFGVTSPDASMQVPEFLGGKRIPINISQVLQTSATSDVSPQGNTAAYSLTTDKHSAFTKSFTEHGWLIGVACVRYEHSYSQGIERMWSRKDKFDFYFPSFASIAEQPIKVKEIFNPISVHPNAYNDVVAEGEKTFGYQEAWAELRYKPNRLSGEFRPTYPQSLDIWHYGDYYTSQPYLSEEWIAEDRKNVDRTLAVSSNVSDQFICDFYFKLNTTRILPLYSIPGLADHH